MESTSQDSGTPSLCWLFLSSLTLKSYFVGSNLIPCAHTKSPCDKGRINCKWWQKEAPAQKVLVLTDTRHLPIVLFFHGLDLLGSGIDLASESPQPGPELWPSATEL